MSANASTNISVKATFEYGGCTSTKFIRRTVNDRFIDSVTINHEERTVTLHRRHGREDVVVSLDDVIDLLFDRLMDND